MGGPLRNPPLGVQQPQGGLFTDPGVGFQDSQGGSLTDPPPAENKELPRSTAAVDIDISITILDRVLKARPTKADPAALTEARNWIWGYQRKHGREPNAHPPDDLIVAQFLAVDEWPRLQAMLYELMAERKEPGYSYAWFISVALQRIHGIAPAAIKQRRATLKLVPRPPAAPPPAPQQETLSLEEQISNLARAKAMRFGR